MSKNWMRHFEIQIVNAEGKGISLSDFKVKFDIKWADTSWPRVANVTIYNLSPDTCNRILGQEFSKVRMIAGYDGLAPVVLQSDVGKVTEIEPGQEGQTNGTNYGLIFEGDIRFTVTGKENITDSWVLIQAVGDHEAFLYASVNTTLAAGYTLADLHRVAMKSFNAYGVTEGITGEMPTTVFPRGLPLYHSTRDVMTDIAGMCNATWQLVDGQAQMVPADNYISEAIVLNSDTGLIGMPQQTMGQGVNVRCLINPNIRINGLVQIDQASVYRAALDNKAVAQSKGRMNEQEQNGNFVVDVTPSQPSSIAADGVYIVKSIDYTGDTRGQAWYMDLMCFARGDATLLAESALSKAQL
ncbi:hypothetical protein TUM12370_18080 [Salmonella enterica subsp. enterica serovar Choleraesuis]|nr:hypothetical protein TUM12370_18080 [Salmonella enterica subsp. enterica serovar Choleraesuis]